MKFTRILFAVLVAMAGLMLILQRATAEAEAHRVYVPLVASGAGHINRGSASVPNATISVEARAGLSCEAEETVPVSGARITVIADDSSRVAMTDETGYALFSATVAPAVIQIEWPVGFLPCPNSRPIVELPSGAGQVQFTAVASH